MSVYSASDAMQFLRDVVDDAGGDYVYQRANPFALLNVHSLPGGSLIGGCIVGRVFERFVPIAFIPPVGCACQTNDALGNPFDAEAMELLHRAQIMNDRKESWGDILMSVELAYARGVNTLEPIHFKPPLTTMWIMQGDIEKIIIQNFTKFTKELVNA